ncbi:protein of unknown function [Stenotrophomonas maltophilia]|nr:protein of unknown function [Stenotrophomonas maltophilia]
MLLPDFRGHHGRSLHPSAATPRYVPTTECFRQRFKHGVRGVFLWKTDPTPCRPTAAGTCRRRGGSGCGGVSRMDAAAKPPGKGLRRPPQPGPPRHPTECPLLPLPWTLLRRVQGAALQTLPTLTLRCAGSA